MQKLNMTVGRFQPFTQGHLNMVNEGEGPCIIYQITPPEMPKTINDIKVKGKKVRKEQIQHVLAFLNHEEVKLTEDEKEILKRPFTNELVSKELNIVKKTNKNIIDIIYIKSAGDGYSQFNKFLLDNKDKYEAGCWLCGEDRVEQYQKFFIDHYKDKEEIPICRGGENYKNMLKDLTLNTGKGRTEGVSGTAVRNAIINDDKNAFTKIMPKETDILFNDFKNAFNNYKEILESIIKEWKFTTLKDYIIENITK